VNPTIEVDFSEWKKAANELVATSKRTLPDFINGQAMAVVIRALRLTKKADKSRIEMQLGMEAPRAAVIQRGKRKGQTVMRKSNKVRKDSLAARILLKHYNETGKGEWLAPGETLEERAKNFINRRLRGISYIRAGWIPALKTLGAVTKKKPTGASSAERQATYFGRPKGAAVPAKQQLGLIVATIENKVPGIASSTAPYAESGLRAALKDATQDMIATLAKRMKQDMAKNGVK
jgi:hypothetical protein